MSSSSVVIVGAKRTAIGSMLGQFTGVPTTTLGATAIKAALEQSGLAADAVAEVIKRAPQMKKSDVVMVNLSGRGDKDIGILRESLKLG